MRYDKDKLKESLTIEEIKLILYNLGSKEPREDNQGNPMFQTVCHHGDSHKLYYYHDTKLFHCYTHCSESFNIFDLVMRNKKVSFPQAVRYVAETTNKTFGFGSVVKNNQEEIITDWDWISRLKKKEKKVIELPEYSEKVLDVLIKLPHEDWLSEGISYETQEKYEVGYYFRDERISIVHRDINNRFIGLRGRAMKQEDIDAGKKYMPLTIGNKLYNHQTMFNLFGLNHTQHAVKRLKKIMILEGEKSILKSEDIYGENNFTCAACSSQITNFHRDIILSLGVEEVFIGFDKFRARKENESEEKYEEMIKEYQENLLKFAKKFTPYVRTYILWDDFDLLEPKDSPIDKGKEILEQLMKTKYEINTSGVEE
ncbi:hypothetical protein [uncultured Metabacillus sp.]|uniref:hypothetical protein n=1 Tax=uncultured Metabacillus sp. TaxID=2860135 RepID=UPI0026143B30|nr:hypothetical protein [uncultured Metabacillus sp.]